MPTMHIGKIIDNNDEDQEGKCQIYIEYLHHDLQPSQYPWFKQDREKTSNIPEIDDYVWCYFVEERFHRQGYYGNKVDLKTYHTHNETIGSITTAYPDVKYEKLANGCSIAMSSNADTPEISIYHPSAEIYIDPDGKMTITTGSDTVVDATGDIDVTSGAGIEINSGDDIKINSGANIEINASNGASLEKTVLGETLKTILEGILDGIVALTVTSSAPGNPSSPPINAAIFIALKAQLATALSTGVKNN